jgi:16S rRNA (guanine966-N2)-methyltransferase
LADAGRVIAGSARAIRLAAPGPGTRPLGDRVKQTLFAILEPDLRGARFLDLFAGSGAAGIEALSRGAASADFVERDATAGRTIEANLRATKLAGDQARVVRREALAWLESLPPDAAPWDVVVVDPPYAEERLLLRALELLGNRPGIVAPDGRVVAKHFHRTALPAKVGLLASERERRFGETTLTFYRVAPHEPPTEAEA